MIPKSKRLKKTRLNRFSDDKNLLFRVMKHCFDAIKVKIIFPLLFLLTTFPLTGQTGNLSEINSSDSKGRIIGNSLIDKQIEYIRKDYSEKVETPKELINGKEYISYYIRSQSKPLLFPKKKRTATLITTSRKYKNLTLQYDTFMDELIYTDTSRTINYAFPQIELNKDLVVSFSLYFEDDSMHFSYLREPQCTELNLKEGYYEIAYRGKSEYMIRHHSSFYAREGLNEYKYTPENYIRVGKVFQKVTGKQNLLKLFGERSGDIKKYLKTNKIHINLAERNDYVSILKYYDSLIKAK